MNNLSPHPMEEFIKLALPNINWKYFHIKNINVYWYDWAYGDLFEKTIEVIVEEWEDSIEWLDRFLWSSYWFIQKVYEDCPLRNNALRIVEKRRRRKNKKTGETMISKIEWYETLSWTKSPFDLLSFLK